jgi:hypothetical protein
MRQPRLVFEIRVFVVRPARCDEPQAHQYPPSLVRREVGAIEPSRAGEDLLGRVPSPAYDDVVLMDGLRKHVVDSSLDGGGLEVKLMTGDAEPGHNL